MENPRWLGKIMILNAGPETMPVTQEDLDAIAGVACREFSKRMKLKGITQGMVAFGGFLEDHA